MPYLETLLSPIGRKDEVMISLKDKDRDIRIKKIIPCNVDASDLICIFSKYVDKTVATGLASLYKGAIGNEEFVILETDSKIYELNFNYGSPHFDESKKFEKLMTILMTSGLNEKDSFKCISEVFFADVNAEAERRRQLEERSRIEKIAKEVPTWMPKGYKYLTGNMYTGIVIVDEYGNEFTYVPYLEIYVSRYEISLDKDGYASSMPDRKAWVNVKYKEAYNAAINFDPSNKSNLLKSIETIREAVVRKTGNEYPKIVYSGRVELRTGAIPENMIYNIDCLIGNHYCMLQSSDSRHGARAYGCSYKSDRFELLYDMGITFDKPMSDLGFRICLRR